MCQQFKCFDCEAAAVRKFKLHLRASPEAVRWALKQIEHSGTVDLQLLART